MCGRFGLTRPERLDLERFGVSEMPPLEPRFNVTPGTDILAIRERKGQRRAELLHWGLIPYWAKDASVGNRMANARADNAFEKPAFRAAMRARRCLIPADVFYEWQAIPGQRRKQPYAVALRSSEPFALGGLWEYWRKVENEPGIVSCAILTTEPNTLLADIHDRMPVMIPAHKYRTWLDPRTPLPAVAALTQPYPSEEMEAWRISLMVNDPKVDSQEILRPEM